MAYCVYTDVNLMTNLTSNDVANADVTSLIAQATKELNRLINVRVTRERVETIDTTRENLIDGSNKTYYIKSWKDKYFADMNDDGTVDKNDIIVYAVASNGTETTATVSSISTANKSFILETAYSSDYSLYVTYEWCYRNPATPDPLIALACIILTSSYCYAKVNVGRAPQVSFGNMRIYRHIDSFNHYYQRFLQLVDQINNVMTDYSDNEVAM